MPIVRTIVAGLSIIFVWSDAHISASQAAPKPMSRTAFETLLAERSVPESLQTDTLGAWIAVYQHVLLARALDQRLYESSLTRLKSPDCDDKGDDAARLSCEMNRAAEAASSLTAFSAAVELRKDAVLYAERVAEYNPEPLLDALIDLAFAEQVHGSIYATDGATRRAIALQAVHPRLATPKRCFKLAVLRAHLADAKLDDKEAERALMEVVEIALQKGIKSGNQADPDYIDTGLLDHLVRQHLRGRFCSTCGGEAMLASKRWLTEVLTGRADAKDSGTNAHDALFLSVLFAPSIFSDHELDVFARRYVDVVRGRGKFHPDIARLLPKTMPIRDRAKNLALVNLLEDSHMDVSSPRFVRRLELIQEKHLNVDQINEFRDIIREKISGLFEQFGIDIEIPAHLDLMSRYFQSAKLINQAHIILEFLMKRDAEKSADVRLREWAKVASVYVPALARLATLDLALGQPAAALRNLDRASALADRKLRAEWTSGGDGAILTLRDLTPTLRVIAQKRAEILIPSGRLSRNAAGHDTLFRELQRAAFGETALAVEAANQRRILADEGLRDLSRSHRIAVDEAARAAEIAGYNYEAGDVDGVLATAKQTALNRRDALAQELKVRMPDRLSAVTDIDPIPLAEARARLRAGEALTVLHVGSHGIHGFLLDAAGESYAWRTTIRSEVVEGLVRSLRAAGDVSRGPQPFPAAEATRLHALIFGPMQDRLRAYNKLILVGDGPLQSMPYGMLLTRPAAAPTDAAAYRAAALPWLIRTHALALLPSVRMLVTQRRESRASQAPKPFLGVGDPNLAPADSRVADGAGTLRGIDVATAFRAGGGFADVTVLRQLVGLPETGDELRAIAALLKAPPDALLLGADATERAVRAITLTDYRIVAFATHGALAGEVAGTSEPGLVLTPPPTASGEDDGFLALSEISSLRFDADLVLLSACNTATPDGRPRAEGLSGLARGFFYAGARSLLATHWAIPSEASVKLTAGLIAYRAQMPQADWAEALRAATLALTDREGPDDWAHPAYWAGFAVLGVLPAPL